MPVVPGVLLLVVVLELVERLKVLQAQRAQEALLHFPGALEGGGITGGHGGGGGGMSSARRRDAKWEIVDVVHMSRGERPPQRRLHRTGDAPGTPEEQNEETLLNVYEKHRFKSITYPPPPVCNHQ